MSNKINLKKLIQTTLVEFLNENKNFKNGDIISSIDMIKYIEDNELRDSFGIIDDFNEIKEIAYASEFWKLKYKENNYNNNT